MCTIYLNEKKNLTAIIISLAKTGGTGKSFSDAVILASTNPQLYFM